MVKQVHGLLVLATPPSVKPNLGLDISMAFLIRRQVCFVVHLSDQISA